MKASGILMAVLMTMAGGASAADFSALQTFKSSDVKASIAEDPAPVVNPKKPAFRDTRKDELHPLSNGAMYSSSCNLQNGTAVGTIYNHSSDMVRFSGDIVFYYYDKYGREITNDKSHEYVAIWPTSSEKITRSGAPGNAVSCSVEAIEDEQTPLPPTNPNGGGMGSGFIIGYSTYTSYGEFDTDCSLNDGITVAIMNNRSSALLLTYDGWMHLYYADKDGCVLSTVSIKGKMSVRPNSSETILKRSGDIPEKAVSCGITRNMDIQWSNWSSR